MLNINSSKEDIVDALNTALQGLEVLMHIQLNGHNLSYDETMKAYEIYQDVLSLVPDNN